MRVRDIASETWEALDANRGRSFLTILGIVIGISAVIAMTALIGGIKQGILDSMGVQQSRAVMIQSWQRGLTNTELDSLREKMSDFEYITPVAYSYGEIAAAKNSEQTNLMGYESDYFKIYPPNIISGRVYTAQENKNAASVTVIDEAMATKLFGGNDEAVGQSVRINGQTFQVIGVVRQDNSMMGGSGAFVPYKTMMTRFQTDGSGITSMVGMVKEGADIEAATKAIGQELARVTDGSFGSTDGTDTVYVQSMKQLIDSINSAMAAFQALMTSVASISLLVGGIGIMNMMLTNVTERIREIGLRKALGARRSDITLQFLVESIVLCLIGGAIGLILGYLGAFGLSGIASSLAQTGSPITPVLDPMAIISAVGICVFIGVIFGYYPARRAAKLDPVESLHYQ